MPSNSSAKDFARNAWSVFALSNRMCFFCGEGGAMGFGYLFALRHFALCVRIREISSEFGVNERRCTLIGLAIEFQD